MRKKTFTIDTCQRTVNEKEIVDEDDYFCTVTIVYRTTKIILLQMYEHRSNSRSFQNAIYDHCRTCVIYMYDFFQGHIANNAFILKNLFLFL